MSALSTQVGGSHYKDLPIQPAEFCQRNQFNYCESSAIKYISRHRHKGGVQDIDKAIHFLKMLKQMEYGGEGAKTKERRPLERELRRLAISIGNPPRFVDVVEAEVMTIEGKAFISYESSKMIERVRERHLEKEAIAKAEGGAA